MVLHTGEAMENLYSQQNLHLLKREYLQFGAKMPIARSTSMQLMNAELVRMS